MSFWSWCRIDSCLDDYFFFLDLNLIYFAISNIINPETAKGSMNIHCFNDKAETAKIPARGVYNNASCAASEKTMA